MAGGCAQGIGGTPGNDDARVPDGAVDSTVPDDVWDATPPDADAEPQPCEDQADCDDGLVCNGVERCEDNLCVGGEEVNCDDSVACTVDSCIEPTGTCSHTPDSTLCPQGQQCHAIEGCRPVGICELDTHCDDGAACNGEERCAPGTAGADPDTGCVPGTPVLCDDGIDCTTDLCVEPSGACEHVPAECLPGANQSCGTSCGSTGSQACGQDCIWGACTPPPEVCNGIDDNCSGVCDDGFTCCAGTAGSCATSCGTTGSRTCSSSCSWGACTPPAEVCNGIDDNCNGVCDEGFACCAGTSGTCATSCGTTGSRTCSSSCSWGACTPPPEVCNGIDDDCDGLCDEGFACCAGTSGSCATSCGTTGSRTCSSSCAWGACMPPPEVCNGIDDDCDGLCDEGFACCAGTSGTCATSCGTTGTRTCSSSCSWGACTPPPEVCNGIDDDCDGLCDEGFACCAGTSGTCTEGGCSGTRTCSGSCSWGTCNLGAAPANNTCGGTVPTIAASGTFSFSTCAASNSFTASCGGGAGSPDVIFRLTLSQRSDVVLETTTGNFDTVLHLRSGATCPGSEIACDDDGGAGALSRIAITLDAGTYWVVVDGYGSGNQGIGNLAATITPQAPPNDTCAGATPISLNLGRTTITGNTSAANDTAGSCSGAPDLWYSFTLSRQEVVLIHTYGSAYDTYLELREGSCGGTQTCVDDFCGTLQSQIVRRLSAGTHYILVDGFGTSSGAFTLTIEHLPVGNSGSWTLLGQGTSTHTGSTSGTGVLVDCVTGTAPENMHYFTRCPSASASGFTGHTCNSETNYDTAVYLWSGATGGSLACNDDSSCSYSSLRSRIENVPIPAGAGLYGYYVDGYGSASGTYSTTVTVP